MKNKNLKTFVAAGLGALLFVSPLHLVPLLFRTSAAEQSVAQAANVLDQSVNVLGAIGQGSGVLFHSEFGFTYVLTGAHVVEGVPLRGELEVTRGAESWPAVLTAYDEKRDLALLRLSTIFPVGRGAKLVHEDLAIGTPLLHVGNVLGRNDSFVAGHLSAKGREIDGQEYWQSSVLAWPGSSGGGVFTTDGRLAGVILRGVGPGLNFFAPVETIKAFAQDRDLQWLLK